MVIADSVLRTLGQHDRRIAVRWFPRGVAARAPRLAGTARRAAPFRRYGRSIRRADALGSRGAPALRTRARRSRTPHPAGRLGRSGPAEADGAGKTAPMGPHSAECLHRDEPRLVSVMAAGVAFWTFLSIFPAMSALISIYGLVSDPAVIATHFASLAGVLPQSALELVGDQMNRLISAPPQALGLGLVISLLLALWYSMSGTGTLMQALTVAYEERGYARHSRLLCAVGGADDRHRRVRAAEPVPGRGRPGRARMAAFSERVARPDRAGALADPGGAADAGARSDLPLRPGAATTRAGTCSRRERSSPRPYGWPARPGSRTTSRISRPTTRPTARSAPSSCC